VRLFLHFNFLLYVYHFWWIELVSSHAVQRWWSVFSPKSAPHSRSVNALRDNCSAQRLHDVIVVMLTALDIAAVTSTTRNAYYISHSLPSYHYIFAIAVYDNRIILITSTIFGEVLFSPATVCLSVCYCVNSITGGYRWIFVKFIKTGRLWTTENLIKFCKLGL